jgi:protein-tyrosine-phosphatase
VSEPPRLIFLCTGNAARSVMAGMMMEQLAPGLARITTAGTHVIEGQPMSWRTRDAIKEAGFSVSPHRSHQLTDSDARSADLIVALAAEHVAYVRRQHAHAAPRTATLKRLCKALDGPSPDHLGQRVAALGLAAVELESWEDVIDPAGGDLPEFVVCAEEVRELTSQLIAGLEPPDAN